MSIKIENLNLRPGDHVFIYINGCAENSIYIAAAKDGTGFVSGPFNNKSRAFRCAIPGWTEVSSEERQRALNADPSADKCEHGVSWSMECLSCGPSDHVAATASPAAPKEEAPRSDKADISFEEWKQRYAPNDSGKDYDLRGAFAAGLTPDENGHWSDMFKLPNHPTFSVESIYAVGENVGKAGHWEGNRFVLTPSPNAAREAAEEISEWLRTGNGEVDANAINEVTEIIRSHCFPTGGESRD